MIVEQVASSKLDLEIFNRRIEIVKQEIEFERKTFGHAYPHGDSIRVSYLRHDLRILNKQRAELVLLMREDG